MNKGLIFDIRRFTIHDGPGIRTTVFFKGCPLKCWWCHNPESQACHPESFVKAVPLDNQSFRVEETAGRWMTVNEVMDQVTRDLVFYEESQGGVTLSGGEPLFQPDFLLDLLIELKQAGFHVALDTSGYAAKDVLHKIASYPDTFLYDLKLMDDHQHMKYTGVSNVRILGNLNYLLAEKKHVIIRVPVIPGVNDTAENTTALLNYLTLIRDLHSPVQGFAQPPFEINLLPHHSLGKRKYSRFEMTDKMKDHPELNMEQLKQMKKQFEQSGFSVIL